MLAVCVRSGTMKQKQKPLDLSRSSALPRYIEKKSDSKVGGDLLSQSLDSLAHKELRGLQSSEEGSNGARKNIRREIEDKRAAELAKRKQREKDMFTMDRNLLDTFSLPGKPEEKTVLKAEPPKKVPRSPVKKQHSSLAELEAEAEKSFLPHMLEDGSAYDIHDTGLSISQSPDKRRILSDLDEISTIMQGIVTSDDAINFFARYGSDTPVQYRHHVAV